MFRRQDAALTQGDLDEIKSCINVTLERVHIPDLPRFAARLLWSDVRSLTLMNMDVDVSPLLAELGRLDSLCLKRVPFSDAFAAKLAVSGRNLAHLYLDEVNVTDRGVNELATAAASWPKLTCLQLKRLELTDRSAAAVANLLPKLDVAHFVGLGWRDAKPWAQALACTERLRALDFSGVRLDDTGLLVRAICALPKLQYLFLEAAGITDQDIATLADVIPRLIMLIASRNPLTDASVPVLTRAGGAMRKLSLKDTNITEEGMAEILKRVS